MVWGIEHLSGERIGDRVGEKGSLKNCVPSWGDRDKVVYTFLTACRFSPMGRYL
ncbi:MAG: hypothetical protein SAJ12_11585 [Jaaginema sp. PMC 1079.18]|nr:hypothetical protein [Jaaginema sp. PMC 1079.18]